MKIPTRIDLFFQIFGVAKKQKGLLKSMNLPHLQFLESRTIEECLAALSTAAEQEICLAVSNDFYESEHLAMYEKIYSDYQNFFEQITSKLSKKIGEEPKIMRGEDSEFPDGAVGELIAVWFNHQTYLRLHHEDKELPIIVALSTIGKD